MERVDLSNAKLDGAQLLGVRMVCSNLEKACLQNCNFEDPAGSVALMEGLTHIVCPCGPSIQSIHEKKIKHIKISVTCVEKYFVTFFKYP